MNAATLLPVLLAGCFASTPVIPIELPDPPRAPAPEVLPRIIEIPSASSIDVHHTPPELTSSITLLGFDGDTPEAEQLGGELATALGVTARHAAGSYGVLEDARDPIAILAQGCRAFTHVCARQLAVKFATTHIAWGVVRTAGGRGARVELMIAGTTGVVRFGSSVVDADRRATATRLWSQVAKPQVTATVVANVERAVVFLDGRLHGTATARSLPLRVGYLTGTHTVRVEAPGFKPVATELVFAPGDTTLEVWLVPVDQVMIAP